MDIRSADLADFAACQALPDTIQSTHVWQLRLVHPPLAPQPGDEVGGILTRTRLPRPVTLAPASQESLADLWQRATEVLVAEEQATLVGYVVLTTPPELPATRIERLVVAPALRRQGIGGLLLAAAMQWSRSFGYEALIAFCAARNDPAARFYLRYGLRFAGYSEALLPRGEIALFFQRSL
ncbi:GNAT family N-acetyltransferase [Kallotenue papyrolyticum]|uniref:GNAT family N-acetyltransferase n=1 Tax=Kallotenue papyrolyticum TaxID=1325125 RepID=UPI0004926A10|nr:GNAT family N-acetyltransferase [Kallotenue papyrolyticum]